MGTDLLQGLDSLTATEVGGNLNGMFNLAPIASLD
jgi:hypothetical protein